MVHSGHVSIYLLKAMLIVPMMSTKAPSECSSKKEERVRYRVCEIEPFSLENELPQCYTISRTGGGLENKVVAQVQVFPLVHSLSLYTLVMVSYDHELQEKGLLPKETRSWKGLCLGRLWAEYAARRIAQNLAASLTPPTKSSDASGNSAIELYDDNPNEDYDQGSDDS